MATISIIIPVYNAERFLAFTLNSILKQTYQKFEVLLVDDGSTDGSAIICDEYSEKDNRFKATHINNSGVSHARNVGLSLASGEYVFFCDADDMLHPESLQILHNIINQEDCELVFSNRVVVKQEKHPIQTPPNLINLTIYGEDDELIRLHQEHPECFTVVWGKLYKISLIRKIGLMFKENISWGEDVLFISSYISTLCRKVVYVDSILYNYRETENSLSRKSDLKQLTQSLESFRSYVTLTQKFDINSSLSHQIKFILSAEIINNLYKFSLGIKGLADFIKEIYNNQSFMIVTRENVNSYTNKQRIFIFIINHAPWWLAIFFVRLIQLTK